jgi:hypothetical protein
VDDREGAFYEALAGCFVLDSDGRGGYVDAFESARGLVPPGLSDGFDLVVDAVKLLAADPSVGYSGYQSRLGIERWRDTVRAEQALCDWLEAGYGDYIAAHPDSWERPVVQRTTAAAEQLFAQVPPTSGVRISSHLTEAHPRAGAIVRAQLVATPGPLDVTGLLRWFRSEAPSTGLWPVTIQWVDTWPFSNLTSVVASGDLSAGADRIDAAEWLRTTADRRLGDRGDQEADADEQADSPPGDSASQISHDRHFRWVGTTEIDYELLLVPTDRPSSIISTLRWSDGNNWSCEQHLAALRYFERAYGAELVNIDGATMNLALPSPLDDPAVARDAARERSGYGDTTTGADELETLDEITAANLRDTVWEFWWD